MSELRNATSAPRSLSPTSPVLQRAPNGKVRPARGGGPARTLCRAALSLVPCLLLAAGCLSEEEAGDDPLEGGDPTAQGTTAGMGGSSTQGNGGTQGTMTGTGGSMAQGGSSSSSSAGSSQGSAGADSQMSVLDAAPGETGIFVGMTAAHNAARRSLDLDPPLPDLTWSEELAAFAQEWADNLASDENCGTIFHRMQSSYGENIAFRGTSPLRVEYSPEEAVESWFAEIDCWDYGTIRGTESCDPECIRSLNSSGCGHFTQIAWRNSREVGCGYATCQDGRYTNEVWVCNYDPPGNYVGQTPY